LIRLRINGSDHGEGLVLLLTAGKSLGLGEQDGDILGDGDPTHVDTGDMPLGLASIIFPATTTLEPRLALKGPGRCASGAGPAGATGECACGQAGRPLLAESTRASFRATLEWGSGSSSWLGPSSAWAQSCSEIELARLQLGAFICHRPISPAPRTTTERALSHSLRKARAFY